MSARRSASHQGVTPPWHPGTVIEQLEDHVEAMRELVGELEPATLTPEAARQLLELAAAVERLGAGLKILLTPRALVDAPWAEQGFRTEAAWLAEQVRSSVPQARAMAQSAERVEKLPALAEAAAKGALSSTEIAVLAAAAVADPDQELHLLEASATLPVHELLRYSKICAQAAHDKDPAHRAYMTSERYGNLWTNADGMVRLSAAMLPEDGMHVAARVRSMAAHLGAEARRAGESPTEKQLAADALVALVLGDQRWATFSGPRAELAPRADLVVVAELDDEGGGPELHNCRMPGLGPVPSKVLESFLGDARLDTVERCGVDVRRVTHHGRVVSNALQRGLLVRDPACVVPGCQVEIGLEVDHWQVPFSEGGPTELWNLCRLCKTHHRMKTYDGYVLSGGPGKWEWRPPD